MNRHITALEDLFKQVEEEFGTFDAHEHFVNGRASSYETATSVDVGAEPVMAARKERLARYRASTGGLS